MLIYADSAIPHDALAERVIADALRAERSLSHDPDLAAYYLDGALRALIVRAAAAYQPDGSADSLLMLDIHDPPLARRFRLALRAPSVEARIVHLWSLIDLLNAHAAPAASRKA